jgi:hypothetical protein
MATEILRDPAGRRFDSVRIDTSHMIPASEGWFGADRATWGQAESALRGP